MTNEEYGVMKWMSKRFNNSDTIYLIHRYGTVNNVEELKNEDYKETVCKYIQKTGFALFTTWINAYLDEKNKRREDNKPKRVLRKRLGLVIILALFSMNMFAQHDKILVELFTIGEEHPEIVDYFSQDPRVEFVHWYMQDYEDEEMIYQRKRRLDNGFDKTTGFWLTYNGKAIKGVYGAVLDSLFYFYPTNKIEVKKSLNRLKIAVRDDSMIWIVELPQDSYKPAHAQLFFLKTFDVLNTSIRTGTKKVLIFTEESEITKLVTTTYPKNGIH